MVGGALLSREECVVAPDEVEEGGATAPADDDDDDDDGGRKGFAAAERRCGPFALGCVDDDDLDFDTDCDSLTSELGREAPGAGVPVVLSAPSPV